MTKNELIARIAEETNMSKTAATLALESLASITAGQLATTGEFTVPGIGKLTVAQRAARTGRNPRTGEPVEILAARAVKFKAAKALRDAVTP